MKKNDPLGKTASYIWPLIITQVVSKVGLSILNSNRRNYNGNIMLGRICKFSLLIQQSNDTCEISIQKIINMAGI